MDAFEIHRRLIEDYRGFTSGFVDIADERIHDHVSDALARGAQWPDPWLSLNPSFSTGGRIDELVDEGLLHPGAEPVFRVKSGPDDPGATPISLHRHQRDAVEAARTGESYVLTTGTGSGKSLAYIVPIVDHVIRHGSGRGVQAIVVYPMNALANSQMEELRKFLTFGFPKGEGPVTFARYTGQEDDETRQRILAKPPDILLTNYVMLELVLTRPDERSSLVRAAEGLRFLVLDELHTYRGRQGADVAMLVRRVRQATRAGDRLQCIGTSATMSSKGTVVEQKVDVASVASRIFGADVTPDRVIGETLVRGTLLLDPAADALAACVRARGDAEADDPALHAGYESLRGDPLASWIEDRFGLAEEPGTGTLVRRSPTTVSAAAADLAGITGEPEGECAIAIRATLLAGSRSRAPDGLRPLFAFRLHQFVSKGGSVYVTAQDEAVRDITLDFQLSLPPGADDEPERRLYPLAFCRECGQEYLMVRKEPEDPLAPLAVRFVARHESRVRDQQDGYLYVSAAYPWPKDPVVENRLPASWLEESPQGVRVVRARRDDVPSRYLVGEDGSAVGAAGAADPADPADRGVLVAGDALMTEHALVTSSSPQLLPEFFNTDTTQARASLDLLRPLGADVVIPGHGPTFQGTPNQAVDLALQHP